MVKANNTVANGGPPPPDESWWQALLTQEEQHSASNALKSNPQPIPGARATPQHATPALEGVDWERAFQLYHQDQTVTLRVTGYNRGGLLVNGPGLQGFVPVSHLVESASSCEAPESWLETYLDRALRLKVIECDQGRGRVVFSERAALSEPGRRNQLLLSLKPGDCISGIVTNITDFGVFVDLGGVEGLIHVSEISWGRVQHPADIVQLDQTLKVYVIQVDRERARVALSLKRLYPNPWQTAEQRYYPGQVVEAVVTSLVPFGAFARLEEGLDGLIHISEIFPDGELKHPAEILQEGQPIRVRVIQVDGARQRLGLSLLQSDLSLPVDGEAESRH